MDKEVRGEPRGSRAVTGTLVLGMALALLTIRPAPVRADDDVMPLLALDASLAMALTAPQYERFGPGASGAIAVQLPLNAALIPVARLGGVFLSDGQAPRDVGVRDPGVGALGALTLGLRLRPAAFFESSRARAIGPWIEIDAGGAVTGSLVRPFFEAGLGYGFDIGDVRLGPTLRVQHVLHFDDPLDSSPALLGSLGVELVLLDRRDEVVLAEETPAPEVASDDRCPGEDEDVDGFEDEDGCLDRDDDRDGIDDVDDACPREPEDRDGWGDEDGCPEADFDGDRILDEVDACPDRAEVMNGVDDEDGCPDEGLIEMVGDRVVIEEQVLFATERARVRSTARPVLRAVATLLGQHPDWGTVRIEGHADVRGRDGFNLALSERRAREVYRVLIELGVPSERLALVGLGESRPRDAGQSEDAHQRNRRVEFVVVQGAEVSP